MKKFPVFLSVLCLTASLMIPASAATPMEYTINGPGDPEYGKPTSSSQAPYHSLHPSDEAHSFRCSSSSDCNRYAGLQSDFVEGSNMDRSKNAALAPPAFGSYSADTLNTGTPLTPNLAPGYQPTAGAVVNGSSVTVRPPDMSGSAVNGASIGGGALYVPGSSTVTATNPGSTFSGYTAVTNDLYYSNGSLGMLKIPAIGLNVKIVQGTGSSALKKGAGHFEDTSIWDGNVALAAVRPDRA